MKFGQFVLHTSVLCIFLCACNTEPTIAPKPQPSIDSLAIAIDDGVLHQQLYSAVPCISYGWDIQLSVVLRNRNSSGTLDSIKFTQVEVNPADTVNFAIELSTTWNGAIDAGKIDTIILSGFVARTCRDPYYVGTTVPIRISWNNGANSQVRVVQGSLGVTAKQLPA